MYFYYQIPEDSNYFLLLLLCFNMLQDRYGIGNLEPIIDKSQDWFLLGHQKSDGWTSFEFKRNLTTCDDQDLDIEVTV